VCAAGQSVRGVDLMLRYRSLPKVMRMRSMSMSIFEQRTFFFFFCFCGCSLACYIAHSMLCNATMTMTM